MIIILWKSMVYLRRKIILTVIDYATSRKRALDTYTKFNNKIKFVAIIFFLIITVMFRFF